MKRFLALSALLALSVLGIVSCGGGGNGLSFTTNPQAGAVFVTGEDAPLPSVLSLNLTINSITLTGASNSPQLVSSPITVDFARLVGLRAPLAFNAVPLHQSDFCVVESGHQLPQCGHSSASEHAERHIYQSDRLQSPNHIRRSDLSYADGGWGERFGRNAHRI